MQSSRDSMEILYHVLRTIANCGCCTRTVEKVNKKCAINTKMLLTNKYQCAIIQSQRRNPSKSEDPTKQVEIHNRLKSILETDRSIEYVIAD